MAHLIILLLDKGLFGGSAWWQLSQYRLGRRAAQGKSDSEHRRAGFELQLGWRDDIGDFKYDVSANLTYFDELMALDESEGESSVMNPYQRTQQNKGYYGLLYHNLGYYVSAEDVYNSVGLPVPWILVILQLAI